MHSWLQTFYYGRLQYYVSGSETTYKFSMLTVHNYDLALVLQLVQCKDIVYMLLTIHTFLDVYVILHFGKVEIKSDFHWCVCVCTLFQSQVHGRKVKIHALRIRTCMWVLPHYTQTKIFGSCQFDTRWVTGGHFNCQTSSILSQTMHTYTHYFVHRVITESVDSPCRDGADAQYMQYLSKSRITSPQTCKKLI